VLDGPEVLTFFSSTLECLCCHSNEDGHDMETGVEYLLPDTEVFQVISTTIKGRLRGRIY